MTRHQRVLIYAILILAVGLRLALAILNREANDNHMQVVQLILQTGRLPVKADCWECFQPKLFHASVAGLSRVLNLASLDAQIVLAQFLNLLLGLVTLWVLWRLLQELEIGEMNARILVFGLLALNPNLVTTDIQAVNDTFTIAFSSLAIYFAWHFINRRKFPNFALMTLFSVLAASSKTNGAVTVIAICGFLGLSALFTRNFNLRWSGALLPALLFGLLSLGMVALNPLNQYIQNIQLYGSPVTLNMERADPPQFIVPTETLRPGIVSIVDGFATFKLPSLLVDPQITSDNHHYPDQRTSFWTILYGRSNFIQYDPWPQTWINTSRNVRNLGRVLYVLALVPTAVLLAGLFLALKDLLARPSPGLVKTGAGLAKTASGFFLTILAAYLGFAIFYALEYRIYTVIKTIFIFPALLSLVYLYLRGFDGLNQALHARLPWLSGILQSFIILLLLGYVIDISILILQLAKLV